MLLLFFAVSPIPRTSAQTKEWDKTLGGSMSEEFTSIVATADGGYLLGGSSPSGVGGDKSQPSLGNQDYWVVKVNANGNKIWDKTFSSNGNDYLKALTITKDGGYLLGGYSDSSTKSGDKSEDGKGGQDYWIVKLDANGNKVWDKTIGGEENDRLESVQQISDGGYILGGSSYSGVSGDKSEDNKGKPWYTDYWLVKLSVDGTIVWERTIGGWGSDILSLVQQTSDKGYILGGYSNTFSWEETDYNFWVVKLDDKGTKIWDQKYGGTGQDYLCDIETTPDGGYLLGGQSDSGIEEGKSEASKGDYDYWVIKINRDGTKLWDKTIGGDGPDYFQDFITTADGGFLLGGQSSSNEGGDKSEASNSNYDYWIVKITGDGVNIWDKTYGGNGEDYLRAVIATPDRGYLLGGYSTSGISGDKSEAKRGGADYWLVKAKNLDTPYNPYCEPAVVYGCSEFIYINNFSFNNLVNNSSGCNGKTKSYINYSPMGSFTTVLNRGQTYNISLEGDGSNAQSYGVWIDYNNDNDFADTGEFVYKSPSAALGTFSGTITIPTNVTDGLHRMRVSTKYFNTFSGSEWCGSTDYGETEDYTITVAEPLVSSTQWNLRYGGTGNEGFTAIIKTSDGGYLSGGYSPSSISGDKTQGSQGKNDFWIVKTDANGNKLWDKTYGGSDHEYLNRIIQTQDGGYLLAGVSQSGIGGDKTQSNRGDRDYWIVKISSTGVKQWDKRYGGSGYDELKKVLQLPTGEYILAGYSNSPAGGDKSQGSQGGTDFWLIKVSRTGTKIWDKRYGGTLNEELGGIVQTSGGGFLLGGTSASGINGEKSEVSRGGKDFWLISLDKNGTKLWDKTYGGSGEDEAYSLGKSGSEYFISGQSDSPAGFDKTRGSQGGKDFWFLKFTSTGEKIWDKRFGGILDEELRASVQTSDGGYLLAGKSFSNKSGNKTQNSQGSSDYWIVKTDADGMYQWDKRYGGSEAEELRAVIKTPDGGLLLAGKSISGVSGDRTQPSQGGADFWLVKVAPETTAIVAAREATRFTKPVNETKLSVLQAYPNPFKEQVTVNFTLPQTQTTQVKVYDSQGREITTLFQGKAQANQTYEIKWLVNKQAAGMYLLQLQTPTLRRQQKLLLTK
ncbi:GEVED domain-containing protein [Adhaeribacter arboris]|uniref:GEVED domain-containing protein n=1 Tax=Adhaeribacter arboris TaxID=2072846 RepID=UPI001304A263|nr:GEVED domain-containing protein [Adhaeribacter arboris]